MEILEDIINNINDDAPVSEVRRGLHWTAVVSRRCGLASTLADGGCGHGESGGMDGSYTDMSALELARFCLGRRNAALSMCVAAINSLTEINPDKYDNIEGLQIVKEFGIKKNISVIGHFPNLNELSGVAKNLWIIEKQPMPGDHSEDAGKKLIPQSDIVVITSTTLINNTLTGILEICKKGSIKMLLGPSTPLSPVLFDYGIDILAGSIVTDMEPVLKSVGEGVSFMQLKKRGGVKFMTMVRDYADIKRRMTQQ
ncbi:MAG: DUF364 domain-containing protein [Spirochaetes bacterium]|nr:DUF364 domain-containing protein [Spirochaetota bacterium]